MSSAAQTSVPDEKQSQECPKTPENSSPSSSSLEGGIIRRGKRRGAYPTSKRKILVCNAPKISEFRVPSDEEIKKREAERNATREAMLDYEVSWRINYLDQKLGLLTTIT